MTERADVDERTRALRTIADIAREHSLSAADVAAALREASATESEDRRQHVLVRVLGYLGGTFVFAGIGVFIALQWDQLNSAARRRRCCSWRGRSSRPACSSRSTSSAPAAIGGGRHSSPPAPWPCSSPPRLAPS